MKIDIQPVMTYEAIAQELGLTRSGIRKIEQKALRKLHKALADRGLSFDDLLPTSETFDRQELEQ